MRCVWKPVAGLVAAVSISIVNVPLAKASGWTFKVSNSGKLTIVRIEAAPVGTSDWGEFTDSDLNPGQTVTLEWAPSTDSSDCSWQLRAVYADGPSEPETFDFCEKTDLEFTN
jgi:hypothetical protein